MMMMWCACEALQSPHCLKGEAQDVATALDCLEHLHRPLFTFIHCETVSQLLCLYVGKDCDCVLS